MARRNSPRGGRVQSIGLSVALALIAVLGFGGLAAHPDLDLQVEELTRQIGEQPGNAELYLKRGDLHRRHEDWHRAGRDFSRVRELQPDHPLVDWFEGRYLVRSGAPAEGARLLSRFLERQPEHPAAWHERAVAHWQLGDAASAADDYARAIEVSARPAPSLFRALAIARIPGSEPCFDAAAKAVRRGVERFPGEVGLLGLATDLALARSERVEASAYLAQLPARVRALPQWAYRDALLACLEGQAGTAEKFGDLLRDDRGQRPGTWTTPTDRVARLAADPSPGACRAAARHALASLQP